MPPAPKSGPMNGKLYQLTTNQGVVNKNLAGVWKTEQRDRLADFGNPSRTLRSMPTAKPQRTAAKDAKNVRSKLFAFASGDKLVTLG